MIIKRSVLKENNPAKLETDWDYENSRYEKIGEEEIPNDLKELYMKNKKEKKKLNQKIQSLTSKQLDEIQRENKITYFQKIIENLKISKKNEIIKNFSDENFDENSLEKFKKMIFFLFGEKESDEFFNKNFKDKIVFKNIKNL